MSMSGILRANRRGFTVFRAARRDRPGDRRRHRQGTRPPARRNRADRVGEHRQPRRARGARLGAHQQVRRGLAGPALLRRLPVSSTSPRRWRSSASRSCSAPGFANVQPHSGASANVAAFFALMQPGDTFLGPQSRRRRASEPRLAGQRLGQVVQGGALRRAPRRSSHRHGRGGAALAEQHKPKVIVAGGSAYPRIIDFRASARSPTASAPS